MPELPEVETMVRGIRPFLEGRRIRKMELPLCACRPLTISPGFTDMAALARGQRIAKVRRRAKRCVLELENGHAMVIEPRMTGLLLLADPPDKAHLRLAWRMSGRQEHNTLWFWDRRGLGTIKWYDPAALARLLSHDQLGPDALEMQEADWLTRCAATSRAIKVAMLDQSFAAGIGNLYASEILHRAGIHPATPACRLTSSQVTALSSETRAVLEEAIFYEGSTLGDGTYRNALNKAGGYQNVHRVYQRTDQPCLTCGAGPIERIVQAQRATFFCPACQKLPRATRKK